MINNRFGAGCKSAKSVTLEPFVGGEIVEIAHDGKRHLWGSVSTYNAPNQLTLNWHVNSTAEYATEVDVTFHEVGSNETRVDLIHRNWERLAENAEQTRDGYNQGWVGVFEQAYAAACS